MYILSNVDLVEVNSKLPMIVRFAEQAVGLNTWRATTLNIDTGEITVVSNTVVYEVCGFTPVTTVKGSHIPGTTKLVVEDSSSFAVNMPIRLGNLLFKIIAVEPATHILTLDRRLEVDVDDGVTVHRIDNPEYLGVYKAEVPMLEVGRFVVTLTDGHGLVNPVENVVEVVISLDNTSSSNGKLTAIGGNTLT